MLSPTSSKFQTGSETKVLTLDSLETQRTALTAMLLNGGPGAFGANQEGISLLITVTYEFIQLIAYF